MKRIAPGQANKARAERAEQARDAPPWKDAGPQPAGGTKRKRTVEEEEWRPSSASRRGQAGAVEDRWWL